MDDLQPDLEQAQRFLSLLDPDAEAFTFQFATDAEPKPEPDHRAGAINLPVDNLKALAIRNGNGCACWVMVNAGDLKGRRAANVLRIRAVFVDLDGAPLAPVLACGLEPHIVVESSPGRFHAYWLVAGLPLDKFELVQKAIAARFGGDPNVHDLPRVMRVAGLFHAKDPSAPFQTRIVQVNERLPYTAAEVLAEFPPIKPQATTGGNGHDAEPTGDLIKQILAGEHYHGPLCMLAFREVADGRAPAKVVIGLRAYMESSRGPRDDRWFDRYESIPGLVSSAEAKLAEQGGVRPAAATTEEPDWPEPDMSVLAPQQIPAPPLPLEVFGSYWSGWLAAQAEAKSCAPDYVAAGLLAGAGALIGNARWGSPWQGWAEPPVLWCAGIGNPSSGKSPGLDGPRDLLSAIEAEANSGRKTDLHEWDTAKRAAKLHLELWEGATKIAIKDDRPAPPRPPAADEPERPAMTRVVTDNPTIERFAALIAENPKGMLLFRDELAGFIGSLERYGGDGSDRAFYLQAYGGRPFTVDRVKHPEPIVIPALSVSICGGIQPDRLRSQVLSGDDDGLAARFLYLWPEPVPPRRPTRVPPSGAMTKLQLLHGLKEQVGQDGKQVPLRFAPAAAEAIQEFRLEVAAVEAEASGLLQSWIGKLPGGAVRLASPAWSRCGRC